MAIYKFKISFEDYDDIYRVIDIKSTQTFLEFHKAILESIGFDSKQLASFYMSTDTWKKGQEITLEDMSDADDDSDALPIPSMSKSRLSEYINDPHQKILYVYDFLELWTFYIELVGIDKEKAGQKYPFCSKTVGLAPKQHDKVQRFGVVEDDEFEEITKNYVDKSDEAPGEISDDEADEYGLFDEDEQGESTGGSDDGGFDH